MATTDTGPKADIKEQRGAYRADRIAFSGGVWGVWDAHGRSIEVADEDTARLVAAICNEAIRGPKTVSYQIHSTAEYGEHVVLSTDDANPNCGPVFAFGDDGWTIVEYETRADAEDALAQWATDYGNEVMLANAKIVRTHQEGA